MQASNTVAESYDDVVARPADPGRAFWNVSARIATVVCCLACVGCATKPLVPYATDTPPLALVPASEAGVQDKRARFREIYCAVLEAHGTALADYRPCEDALTRVGVEPAGSGMPVELGQSMRHLVAVVVPGVGYDCFKPWLNPPGTVVKHLQQSGYDAIMLDVDGLSSSANNARQIRDAILAMNLPAGASRLVQHPAITFNN